jgi:hypothetical protein
MNIRDVIRKQILSCDALDPSVVNATALLGLGACLAGLEPVGNGLKTGGVLLVFPGLQ